MLPDLGEIVYKWESLLKRETITNGVTRKVGNCGMMINYCKAFSSVDCNLFIIHSLIQHLLAPYYVEGSLFRYYLKELPFSWGSQAWKSPVNNAE